jgi:hypothetical protein
VLAVKFSHREGWRRMVSRLCSRLFVCVRACVFLLGNRVCPLCRIRPSAAFVRGGRGQRCVLHIARTAAMCSHMVSSRAQCICKHPCSNASPPTTLHNYVCGTGIVARSLGNTMSDDVGSFFVEGDIADIVFLFLEHNENTLGCDAC